MRQLLVLFYAVVMLSLIYSCKKESSTSVSNSSSIVGKWELKQTVSQVGTVNYTAESGFVLAFTDTTYHTTDSTYKIFAQGNHYKGYYTIAADTSVTNATGLAIAPRQFSNRIILDNDTTSDKIFYQITNNRLTILSGYFPLDGGVEMTFERQ